MNENQTTREETQQAQPSQEEPQTQSNAAKNKFYLKHKRTIRDVCYIALFAAIIVVCTYIAIPISEISITLQTLAVCLAAGLLGFKRGTLSVAVYIFLGICGIPVFTGGKNFYALILSASAGYVIGFLFTAVIVGLASDHMHKIGDKTKNKTAGQILQLCALLFTMAIGVAVCYFFGTVWYMWIYKGSVTAENLQIALTYCVYPYLLPDFVKIVVAAILVNRLKPFVK